MGSTATYALRLTLEGAGVAERAFRSLHGAISAMPSAISAANANLFYFLGNLKSISDFSQKLGGGVFDNLVKPNIQLETATLQFEQLLGSAAAAQARVKDLYQYANETPFSNPDVLRAGRILQAFGGDALGAGKGLRMVGDMASYANTDLGEVAMWVGRAYTAIQSGLPFGEAAMRLQELTLLTGEERNRLEALANAKAPPADVWATFESIMTKTNGTAARLGETFAGVQSTISGQIDELKRKMGERLFEAIKGDLVGFRNDMQEAFDSGRVDRWGDAAGAALRELYETIKDKSIFGLTAEDIFNAAESGRLVELLKAAITESAKNFGKMLYNAAADYGPEIMRAIVGRNTRLSGWLGLDQDAALKNLASGQGGFEANVSQLGIGKQFELLRALGKGSWADRGSGDVGVGAFRAMFGSGDQLGALIQQWARGEVSSGSFRFTPGSVRGQLEGSGLLANTAEMAAQQRMLEIFGGVGFGAGGGRFDDLLAQATQRLGSDLGGMNQSSQAAALENVRAQIEGTAQATRELKDNMLALLEEIRSRQGQF